MCVYIYILFLFLSHTVKQTCVSLQKIMQVYCKRVSQLCFTTHNFLIEELQVLQFPDTRIWAYFGVWSK